MTLRYRAVMFDLGGTLFQDLPAHISTANQRAALASLGVESSDEAALAQAFSQARRETERRLREAGFYAHGDLVRQHFTAGVRRLVGDDVAEQALNTAANGYAAAQKHSVLTWLRPRSDCHDTLAALQAAGCDLSIVSNNDDGYLQGLVQKWRLPNYLRTWLSSDAQQCCKPAPEIFHAALEGTDLAPGDVLYVGDSPADDIVGAHAAGMDVALLRTGLARSAGAEQAEHQIDTLSDLVGLIVRH